MCTTVECKGVGSFLLNDGDDILYNEVNKKVSSPVTS